MKNNYLIIHFIFLIFSFQGIAINEDSLKAKKMKPEYEVTSLEGINTKNSEFCAVPYSNKILFVANQLKDLVNHESFDVNGFPYVDVFSSEITNNKAGKISSFGSKINGPFHDGPVSFNKEQTQLYLTRVEYINKGTKSFINKAKLILFEKNGNGWSDPMPFKYNDESYSVGHASISEDGNYLFFTSDMPGGKGGKDIYVCKKNGTEWEKPENLGAEINTENDEEFPYIRKDGTLFFSSNGHKGHGGFDIFSANKLGDIWYLNRNEGSEINSEGDDFGIVFTDNIHGYFSSNRKGGLGLDDIYRFTFTNRGTDIVATLLLTENINNPSKHTKIYLLNNKGKVIDSTRTDEKGTFQFRNLYGDKQFMASVDPEDIQFNGKARYYLANSKGEIVRVSHPFKKNDFVFEHLPFEQTDLSEVYSDEDLTLSGVLSYGTSPAIFIKNVQLFLKNTFGDVIDTTKTNNLGSFVFNNLVSKQDYVVSINDTSLHLPPGTEVVLRDKNGKSLKSFIVGKDAFDFKLLSHEKSVLSELATDDELSFKFNTCTYGQDKLRLKPVSKKKIYLLDDKGSIIDSVFTNQKGFFKFNNLDVDKEYMTSVEENDLQFSKKTSYYLVNSQGHVVKVPYTFKNRKITFNSIPFDSLSLQEIAVDDKLLLAGNLRFGPQGADPLKNTRVYLINAKGIVIDSITTNELGCFAFRNLPPDQNYIINMNESDMHLPLNTKVILTDKNGKVVKVFYVGKDPFEYKILSAEKNLMSNLETSDDELSMKLSGYVYDIHKKAIAEATVILYDSNGKQLENITTDNKGKFSFRNTKMNSADRLEVISKNMNDSMIYIADSRGKICKQLQKNSSGTFAYKLLDIDKTMIGDFEVDDPWLQVIDMKANSETLIIIESIFYAINDYKFDSAGQKILDKIINVLKSNPKLIIELSSHTDSRYNDSYNLKLSNKRAQYAVNYIVTKGIDRTRLKAIGYGETKLLNQCANDMICSEKEHAMNRRTEFKITYSK